MSHMLRTCACAALLLACGTEEQPAGPGGGEGGTGGSATTTTTGDTGAGGGSGGSGGTPEYLVETKYGIDLIHYARVQKTSRVPNMWISADSIDAIPASGDLPVGTLVVREENEPVDWIFWKEKRADGWYQDNFYPQNPPNFGGGALEGNECLSCHGGAPDTIFTIDMLRRFKTTGVFQTASCDEGGNTPCPPGSYD